VETQSLSRIAKLGDYQNKSNAESIPSLSLFTVDIGKRKIKIIDFQVVTLHRRDIVISSYTLSRREVKTIWLWQEVTGIDWTNGKISLDTNKPLLLFHKKKSFVES
jgi:hypothetical protein